MKAQLVFLSLILTFTPGCSTITYLLDQGAVLARMRQQKIKLQVAGQHPEYQKYRRYFDWIPKVKKFSATVLGFPESQSYESFLPDSEKNHWVLSAVRSDVIVPKAWSFPILGEFPYIGYFDEPSLEAEVRTLERSGYDTYVRTSAAFSGLGFLDMPIFESMMQEDEAVFIEILLHELTHEAYYIYGETAFNEGIAQFIGEQGTLIFLEQEKALQHQVASYRQRLARDHHYRALILDTWIKLKTLLGTDPKLQPPPGWKSKKDKIFQSLVFQLQREQLLEKEDDWTSWNNARLYGAVIYLEDHCHLEALYQRQYPRGTIDDLRKFFDWVQKTIASQAPSEQVRTYLGKTDYCPTSGK